MAPKRRAVSPRRVAPSTAHLVADELSVADNVQSARTWRRDATGKLNVAVSAATASTAVLNQSMPTRWFAELCSIFLPAGYPASVRPEYVRFQAYDTLQAACSYLRNVLTTSALLKAADL